jgi:citrate synthase
MTALLRKPATGLDGVPAAETALSHVDGEKGELIIAGDWVATLAATTSFEEVAARLWALASGAGIEAAALRAMLGEARQRAFAWLPQILAAADGLSVGDGLRAALAALRPEPGLPDEVTILGAAPVLIGGLVQRANGRAPYPPDATASHAADTLSMLHGRAPAPSETAALDRYFVAASDHGMNASTFAARVVASTQADLFAAVTAGYCGLTGPLHGGAPGPVLEMLDAIGTRERIEPWIDEALRRGERLMGFGHRIYRSRDPRADVLKSAIATLTAGNIDRPFAAEVEAYAREALRRKYPDRPLDTNVEFFTAILLDALRIPREAFTPIFAAARIAGWIAHSTEQQRRGRLLRPSSIYTGALPG